MLCVAHVSIFSSVTPFQYAPSPAEPPKIHVNEVYTYNVNHSTMQGVESRPYDYWLTFAPRLTLSRCKSSSAWSDRTSLNFSRELASLSRDGFLSNPPSLDIVRLDVLLKNGLK